ncbi:MAG: Leucyltransferase [Polaromonas sp.]|nr:Leucyltransferase [Polaromonas sp.]
MAKGPRPLPWLEPGEPFPPVSSAWRQTEPAPGLLAAGGALDVPTLLQAYARGIFPWFSEGQPILWWTPDPRMVLRVSNFRLHRSLRKTLKHFVSDAHCEIRLDSAFAEVIKACASKPREGQPGTWIVPAMVEAYGRLHAAGHAHSVETWMDGELAGGLYCVNIGGAVFGESMFAHRTDASKIALAALVAFCRSNNIGMVDCQQNTQHLASLGAAEISRADFLVQVSANIEKAAPAWRFEPVYWNEILNASTTAPT